MKCINCYDTGDTGSGYLDCHMCDAATIRTKLDAELYLPLTDFEFGLYQRGRDDALKDSHEQN